MRAVCESLYEKLAAYGSSDYVAFHMPGHKRLVRGEALPEGLPWQIDITEIDGFDNLHHAEGILKASMDRTACFYGVKRSLYSVNGSTAGILSAVFAATKQGDTILMGRNCHKSVYHAVFLRGLRPLYLYPQTDEKTGILCGYCPSDLERMLTERPDIRAVVLTSPTYEGVISDIRTLADLTHRRGIPLIVDEAHGAHLTVKGQLRQRKDFPVSAVLSGADLVIQSLHKTLPSLTQTGILHVCEQAGESLTLEAARYMSIFQTSSPSYVLMASIDSCLRYLCSCEGMEERQRYRDRLGALRCRLREYRHIRLLEPEPERMLDPSKLILSVDGMNGRRLYDRLREGYHLQPEMCTPGYVLLMTGMWDTDEMYERLCGALDEMEDEREKTLTEALPAAGESPSSTVPVVQAGGRRFPAGRQVLIPSEAERGRKKRVALPDSEGMVSAEYAYLYPPGIPLLVPGERIGREALDMLLCAQKDGNGPQGLSCRAGDTILVLEEQ